MAPFLLLLFLLSKAASDEIVVVQPGDNITLNCKAPDPSNIVLKWIRPDLEPKNNYVFFCRGSQPQTGNQYDQFKGRVELMKVDLENGNISIILKNVNYNDNGTYECRVLSGSRRRKREVDPLTTIKKIQLQFTDPGSKDKNSTPAGRYVGLAAGVAGVMFAFVVAVVSVRKYKRLRDNRPGTPADDKAGDVQLL
ncbi:butyrophilin subfamily 2 member A1-like [Perca fluviatilis]|uniref:butyrophilin subfamily 2 member A1-like n=1 Tax=Perca fluviatilis TaxID=8168 RepID=UPI00196278ED|nr:butyrophilin subfamily 2 member A1-like [Perca fluviatilis]